MIRTPAQPNIVFNVLGGCITLLSLQLPWLTVSGLYGVSVQPGSLYLAAFYWLLTGAILSFISRYAGFMTVIGLFAFLGEPFASFRSASAGVGVLLAFVGMVFTFAGTRWSIPKDLSKGQEILGGALYTVGFLILLTVTVNMVVYRSIFSALEGQLIVQVPLVLAGAFLTIQGLRLYMLRPERERLERAVFQDSASKT